MMADQKCKFSPCSGITEGSMGTFLNNKTFCIKVTQVLSGKTLLTSANSLCKILQRYQRLVVSVISRGHKQSVMWFVFTWWLEFKYRPSSSSVYSHHNTILLKGNVCFYIISVAKHPTMFECLKTTSSEYWCWWEDFVLEKELLCY